jgi:hypothetical protein
MNPLQFPILFLGFLLLQTSTPQFEAPVADYPAIAGVTITAPDGGEITAMDAQGLDPSTVYSFSATIQLDDTWGAPQNLVTEIPDGWTLTWDANFGSFLKELPSGNCVRWTSPDEEGDVIVTATLSGDGDSDVYIKSFRIWVGDRALRSDYAKDHVLVMFQDWCSEECVRSWVGQWPSTGGYRLISSSINAYVVDIDPEVDVLDAANEITWWTSVRSAEPDFVVELLDIGQDFSSETQEWSAPSTPR